MKVMLLASAIDHGTFPAYNLVYYSNELQVKDTATVTDVNMGLSEGRYMNIAQGFAYSSNGDDPRKDNLTIFFKFGPLTRFEWK